MSNLQARLLAEIDRLLAICDEATPGPWEPDAYGICTAYDAPIDEIVEVVSSRVSCANYCYGGSARPIERSEDNEFIAHARDGYPATLKALRASIECHQGVPVTLPGVPIGAMMCNGCGDVYESGVCPTLKAIADALGVDPRESD